MPVMDLGVASYASGSGPVTLDEVGNLYLADGGYGTTHIWRFTSTDVFAAMDDPATNPLDPIDAYLFDTICDSPCTGPRGASSMFIDECLGMVLTATNIHDPSQLRQYRINDDGTNGGFIVMATSDGRMSETRFENGALYVSDPDGIYRVYPTRVPPTVVIGGCDSGVVNRLLGSCSFISELIEECAANSKNHGKFVSCVAKLTNELKKVGIITGKEKGAIQSCAAQADIP
jgi:hypothetical protein